MISRWLPLALLGVVFAPGLLRAQPATLFPVSPPYTGHEFLKATGNFDKEKMYEDIEILRRILDRKLTLLYPSETGARTRFVTPEGQSVSAQWMTNPYQGYLRSASEIKSSDVISLRSSDSVYLLGHGIKSPDVIPLRSLEGVYLLSHGIVYTATVSSLRPLAKAEADSSDKWPRPGILKQNTEWDSIRRQVRQEKDEPKKSEASKPPSLSDVLLKVLAENGHHFSQLGENERLTIVLTVHETNAHLSNRKFGEGASSDSAKTQSQIPKSSVVTDFELLGDLHQKQGHFEEALKAFGTAVSREPSPSANEARRLHRKMAQCYLALGNDQSARKSLDQSLNAAQKESAEAKENPAPAAKPAAALPVKLIVSAPKKLLDQVKEGKITFEEFRRQADVETHRFGDRR